MVSNRIALTRQPLSSVDASNLLRQCMGPLVSLGMLAVIDAGPALPYVALYQGEGRSTRTSALIMRAQPCCDFPRAFQT